MADSLRSPSPMTRVCVFCGSSRGSRPAYSDAARELAAALVEDGIGLVYGGGDVGLMGVLADTVMAEGGEVTGVIPRGLFRKEVAHAGVTRLVEVDSMHARKQTMFELSDGFIALPGGYGTLEELAEIVTWAQLGLHDRPIGLLDIEAFWSPLLALFDRMVDDELLKSANRELILCADEPRSLLHAMQEWSRPAATEKWIDVDET